MEKKFEIVNKFIDIYTNEEYKKGTIISFTNERVEEINRVEKIIGYKLIKEVETPKKENKKNKEVKED